MPGGASRRGRGRARGPLRARALAGSLAEADPDRTVTIVGSRRSGAYGREVARELGFGAASAGLLVVSGMALGCDSAAHEGALDANGATVAVLGGPADYAVPALEGAALPAHPGLRRRGHLGAAVRAPRSIRRMFPARNRIMAALAGFVVIVEGAHRSGTQHTVKQAARLGREVLAVPGPGQLVAIRAPKRAHLRGRARRSRRAGPPRPRPRAGADAGARRRPGARAGAARRADRGGSAEPAHATPWRSSSARRQGCRGRHSRASS